MFYWHFTDLVQQAPGSQGHVLEVGQGQEALQGQVDLDQEVRPGLEVDGQGHLVLRGHRGRGQVVQVKGQDQGHQPLQLGQEARESEIKLLVLKWCL